MSLIPQYLRTIAPATVAAVKADRDDREALLARILECLSSEYAAAQKAAAA